MNAGRQSAQPKEFRRFAWHAEFDAPGKRAPHVLRGTLQLAGRFQERLGLRKQEFTGPGQKQLTRSAFEQCHPEVLLKAFYLGRYCGLCDTKRLRRLGHHTQSCDSDEGAYLIKLHLRTRRSGGQEPSLAALEAQAYGGALREFRQASVVRLIDRQRLRTHPHPVAGEFAQKFAGFHGAGHP